MLICYGDVLAGNGSYESKGSRRDTTSDWVTSSGGGSVNLFAKSLENKESISWDISSPTVVSGGSRRSRFI